MKFKTWLAENKSEFIYPDNIHPTKHIGRGHFAHVYDTNVPGVVMRVEPIMSEKQLADIRPEFRNQSCEKFMMKPEIQATGGVAKIYNTQIRDYDLSDDKNPIFITYKEKVNTNWQPLLNIPEYLFITYGQEQNMLAKELEKYPETKALSNAIKAGLPTIDLHHHNLGLNSKGQLVAIDC